MSDTATSDTTTTEPATSAPATGADSGNETDWKAEAEKWKELSRRNEERAKANATAAKERDELKQRTQTEAEKAIGEAKAEGRAEALRETGGKLVKAEVRAQSAGRLEAAQIDALLEGLNPTAFLTEEGDVDAGKVKAFVDGIAPSRTDDTEETSTTFPKVPDLGQGARGRETMALNGDPILRDVKAKLGIK